MTMKGYLGHATAALDGPSYATYTGSLLTNRLRKKMNDTLFQMVVPMSLGRSTEGRRAL